jgi:ADP-ribosylglycohydrolase
LTAVEVGDEVRDMNAQAGAGWFSGSGERGRGLGALSGLAIGDALGMPTQTLSRPAIRALYGELRWFEPGAEGNEISRGLPAGSITDDTEQALIVARALVAGGGHVDAGELAGTLLAWEADMAARGSRDLLGPSTKRALEAVRRGVPAGEAGRRGDTNGAAMRIAGVGVATAPEPPAALVDRVVEVSRVTHNTGIALAGAAAVAAAVSAGVAGANPDDAVAAGIRAARLGASRGEYIAGADVARRIEWAVDLVTHAGDEARALDLVYELVGTSLATQETVPAAFALVALHPGDPWRVVLSAAGLGGDSDTVAAIAGAIAGALAGVAAFPPAALELVTSVNGLVLEPLVDDLLRLRAAGPPA